MAHRVVAIVTAGVAVLGTAAVFVTDVPPGAASIRPACGRGTGSVMSAVVINEGLSDGQFRVGTHAHIAGRARAIRRATVVDIPAFSVRPSTFTYTYAHKRLVGNAISGCAAHVRSIPPQTGDDCHGRISCAAVTQDDLDQREAEAERLGPGPPIKPSGVRRLVGIAAMDLGPLRRHRDFRLLFIGQGVSFLGSMITYVAFPFQAYEISHSSLVVGLLGAVELVPLLGSALVGGAIADAVDRRRMMQITELAFAGASAALLVNPLLPEPRVWVIFVSSPSWRCSTGSSAPRSRRSLPASSTATRWPPPARSRRFA